MSDNRFPLTGAILLRESLSSLADDALHIRFTSVLSIMRLCPGRSHRFPIPCHGRRAVLALKLDPMYITFASTDLPGFATGSSIGWHPHGIPSRTG